MVMSLKELCTSYY